MGKPELGLTLDIPDLRHNQPANRSYNRPLRKILLLALICILANNLLSQEVHLGAKNGFTTYTLFPLPDDDFFLDVSYSIGGFAEYIPPKALFSVAAEIQYLFKSELLLFPISLNLLFGKRIVPRIIGGVVPVVRVHPIDPNVIFGVGAKIGFGIAFRLNNKLDISSEIAWCFLPERYYYYNHFGPAEVERDIYRILNINIGLGYYIGKE